MYGYRAVVDDAAALGLLLTHGPERFPGAEKGPGQVDGEHLVPDLEFKGIDIDRGSSGTRVVEEKVDSAVALHRGLEQLRTLASSVTSVGIAASTPGQS